MAYSGIRSPVNSHQMPVFLYDTAVVRGDPLEALAALSPRWALPSAQEIALFDVPRGREREGKVLTCVDTNMEEGNRAPWTIELQEIELLAPDAVKSYTAMSIEFLNTSINLGAGGSLPAPLSIPAAAFFGVKLLLGEGAPLKPGDRLRITLKGIAKQIWSMT